MPELVPGRLVGWVLLDLGLQAPVNPVVELLLLLLPMMSLMEKPPLPEPTPPITKPPAKTMIRPMNTALIQPLRWRISINIA